jgi:hypothetical protein
MERFCGSNGGVLLPIVLLGGVHCTSNRGDRSGTSFFVIRSETTSFEHSPLPQMYELSALKSADAKRWVSAIKKANHAFETHNPDWRELLAERCGATLPPSCRRPISRLKPRRALEVTLLRSCRTAMSHPAGKCIRSIGILASSGIRSVRA